MFVRALPDMRGMLFVHEPEADQHVDEEHLHPARHGVHRRRGRIQQIVEQHDARIRSD
jgi:uncharacterized membrane protein (UPF0127 family)